MGKRIAIAFVALAILALCGYHLDWSTLTRGMRQEVVHTADGVIESVDAHGALVSHGPVPSLKWGSMTMEFTLGQGVDGKALQEGARIRFDFVESKPGEWQITRIQKQEGS